MFNDKLQLCHIIMSSIHGIIEWAGFSNTCLIRLLSAKNVYLPHWLIDNIYHFLFVCWNRHKLYTYMSLTVWIERYSLTIQWSFESIRSTKQKQNSEFIAWLNALFLRCSVLSDEKIFIRRQQLRLYYRSIDWSIRIFQVVKQTQMCPSHLWSHPLFIHCDRWFVEIVVSIFSFTMLSEYTVVFVLCALPWSMLLRFFFLLLFDFCLRYHKEDLL